jgi:PAS domain S-box-containing protein
MMGLTDLPLLAEIALAATTLAGMWWAGVRWVWPKLQATGRALSGLMAVGTRADELLESIENGTKTRLLLTTIKHEVLPNGGSSLRDSVNRTESVVNMLVGQGRAHADAEDDITRLECDGTGKVEWLSRALMTWTQRTFEELRDHNWISFIHPEDREDVAQEWRNCIKHGRQFDAAFRVINRSGDDTFVRMSAVPVTTQRIASQTTVRWVSTMRRVGSLPDSLLAPERVTGGHRAAQSRASGP